MRGFYRLRTFHQTVVVAGRATGEVSSLAEAAAGRDHPVLFVYLPAAHQGRCFLLSEHEGWLRLLPAVAGLGILPLGLAWDGRNAASLYDPEGGLWLCAAPPGPKPHEPRRLALARPKIDAYERFTLDAVQTIFVPSPVLERAQRLDRIFGQELDLQLLERLEPGDGPALAAVAKLCSPGRLAGFAQAIVQQPEAARRLARLFPDDLVARQGLPALADWLASRAEPKPTSSPAPRRLFSPRFTRQSPAPATPPVRPQFEQTLSSEFDGLARLGFLGESVSLPHTCAVLARRAVVPRRDLCVIATARNEGIYLLEWLAYHRAIGVEAVFLYTNDNDDGSDELLSALARAGEIYWTRNEVGAGASAQPKAYGHALVLRPEVLDYRWALIIDLDEYLGFDPLLFGDATEFLQWHESRPCDAIALNWMLHGTAGVARWEDGFIGARFSYVTGAANAHVKSLCRTSFFSHSAPHVPRMYRNMPFSFRAANGELHAPQNAEMGHSLSARPSSDFAWISHFFHKSTEEFLWKWSRNRGDGVLKQGVSNAALGADFVRGFMTQFDTPRSARIDLEACAPGLSQEMARLTALPAVADAAAHVKHVYAERIQAIARLFLDAPGILSAGEPGRELLATLGLVPATEPPRTETVDAASP